MNKRRAMRTLSILLALATLLALSAPALAFEEFSKGSKGDAVKGIQTRLVELGFLSGKADGDFGEGTAQAVAAYQEANGLEASGAVDEATFDALYEGVENLFSFRGCKWYGTKADTEQSLFGEGASTHGVLSNENNIYRMDATNYANVTMGDDRVDGGGVRAWYGDVSVAGYNVEDTYACYLYPVVEGQVVHDDEQAEFYFGWYTFESADYSDHEGIYNDLAAKLVSLYGDGRVENGKYNSTTTWKDVQGNQIRLLINEDKNYVTLGYMAYDAEGRLNALAEALENEAKQEEARSREENASNTSGL